MPVQIHYAELRGDDAEEQLRAFMHMLTRLPTFAGAELLSSPAQPGLMLCASRWDGNVPEVKLPPGATAWSFMVRETVSAG